MSEIRTKEEDAITSHVRRALNYLYVTRTNMERRILWFESRAGARKHLSNCEVADVLGVETSLVEEVKANRCHESLLLGKMIKEALSYATEAIEFERLIRALEATVHAVDRGGADHRTLGEVANLMWVWFVSVDTGFVDEETVMDIGASLFGNHRLVRNREGVPCLVEVEWVAEDLDRLKIAVGKCWSALDAKLAVFRMGKGSSDV